MRNTAGTVGRECSLRQNTHPVRHAEWEVPLSPHRPSSVTLLLNGMLFVRKFICHGAPSEYLRAACSPRRRSRHSTVVPIVGRNACGSIAPEKCAELARRGMTRRRYRQHRGKVPRASAEECDVPRDEMIRWSCGWSADADLRSWCAA